MQHRIPIEELGPQGEAMAMAVDKCVHCGFCLATCPTYQVLGEEMDSPRGRIYLMKSVLEGDLEAQEAQPYIDRCLGCMACVTACPSGVEYGDLLAPYRARVEAARDRSFMEKLTRTLVRETLPYPQRFRQAVRSGRVGRIAQGLLPSTLRAMIDLLPDDLPAADPLPAVVPAEGTQVARVAMLTGCVQQVLDPGINAATVRVLSRNGVEVVLPPAQGCCGSLSLHIGEAEQARTLARRNLAAFPDDVDAIITNAAGCGSGIHEYPLLFAGTPDAARAAAFSARSMDISRFLAGLELKTPPPLTRPLTVAYHDACHLAHAQGITAEPRALLAMIPNVTLVPIPDAELCCGSAGTYNLEQPELAREIGDRKAAAIIGTGADLVVTGNIGCMTQLRTHLRALGKALPVIHTVELLDLAYRGVEPPAA